MAEELNPVKTAPNNGKLGILGSDYSSGWGGPQSELSGLDDLDTATPGSLFGTDFNNGKPPSAIDTDSTDFGGLTPGDMFGTQFPSSSGASWQDWLSKLGDLGGLLGGGGAAGSVAGGAAGAAGGSSWLSSLMSSLGLGGGASGLGPYAATAGIGLYEAKQAQKDAQKKADELKALGTPFLNQSDALLKQFNSGTLRPDQQNLVDFTKEQGQNLIQSGGALSAIAQQAFEDYRAGKLPAADEQRLQDQVAAQKQAVRQRLGSAGVLDSTLLTGQDEQIDRQALQARQQLLDSRFATGNQAYDSWLKSTEAGQQLTVQGQKFASDAFETMLNDALGFGTAGMEPVAQSIALAMQSDKDLSEQITTLLGNLASAYAYTQAGPGNAGGGGAAGGASGGTGGNLLNTIVGGIKNLKGLYDKFFGGESTAGGPSAAGGEAAGAAGTTPSLTGPNAIDLGSTSAGNLFGTSGSAALGSSGAVGAGEALGNLGSISAGGMFGTSGSVAAGAGPGSLGGGSLASVTGNAIPTTVEGLGTTGGGATAGGSGGAAASGAGLSGAAAGAIGIAAVFAYAALNPKRGDENRNSLAFMQAFPGTRVSVEGGRNPNATRITLPNGKVLTQPEYEALAGSWYGATAAPDGNQEKYAAIYNKLATEYGLGPPTGKVPKTKETGG